jgi:hypothetical protein
MPRVGFEPTIPVFEQEKRVHALDRAATVIGIVNYLEDVNVVISLISFRRLCNLAERLLKWPQSFICQYTHNKYPEKC